MINLRNLLAVCSLLSTTCSLNVVAKTMMLSSDNVSFLGVRLPRVVIHTKNLSFNVVTSLPHDKLDVNSHFAGDTRNHHGGKHPKDVEKHERCNPQGGSKSHVRKMYTWKSKKCHRNVKLVTNRSMGSHGSCTDEDDHAATCWWPLVSRTQRRFRETESRDILYGDHRLHRRMCDASRLYSFMEGYHRHRLGLHLPSVLINLVDLYRSNLCYSCVTDHSQYGKSAIGYMEPSDCPCGCKWSCTSWSCDNSYSWVADGGGCMCSTIICIRNKYLGLVDQEYAGELYNLVKVVQSKSHTCNIDNSFFDLIDNDTLTLDKKEMLKDRIFYDEIYDQGVGFSDCEDEKSEPPPCRPLVVLDLSVFFWHSTFPRLLSITYVPECRCQLNGSQGSPRDKCFVEYTFLKCEERKCDSEVRFHKERSGKAPLAGAAKRFAERQQQSKPRKPPKYVFCALTLEECQRVCGVDAPHFHGFSQDGSPMPKEMGLSVSFADEKTPFRKSCEDGKYTPIPFPPHSSGGGSYGSGGTPEPPPEKPLVPRVYNIRTGSPISEKCVYVGRNGANAHFGNPYVINELHDRHEVVSFYTKWLFSPAGEATLNKACRELKGVHLVCHCKPELCHGDVLLVVVNGLAIPEELKFLPWPKNMVTWGLDEPDAKADLVNSNSLKPVVDECDNYPFGRPALEKEVKDHKDAATVVHPRVVVEADGLIDEKHVDVVTEVPVVVVHAGSSQTAAHQSIKIERPESDVKECDRIMYSQEEVGYMRIVWAFVKRMFDGDQCPIVMQHLKEVMKDPITQRPDWKYLASHLNETFDLGAEYIRYLDTLSGSDFCYPEPVVGVPVTAMSPYAAPFVPREVEDDNFEYKYERDYKEMVVIDDDVIMIDMRPIVVDNNNTAIVDRQEDEEIVSNRILRLELQDGHTEMANQEFNEEPIIDMVEFLVNLNPPKQGLVDRLKEKRKIKNLKRKAQRILDEAEFFENTHRPPRAPPFTLHLDGEKKWVDDPNLETKNVVVYYQVDVKGSRTWSEQLWHKIKTDWIPFVHHEDGLILNDDSGVTFSEEKNLINRHIDTWRFGTTYGNSAPFSIESYSNDVNLGLGGYKSGALCQIFVRLYNELMFNIEDVDIRDLNNRHAITTDEKAESYFISKTFHTAVEVTASRFKFAGELLRCCPRTYHNTLHHYIQQKYIQQIDACQIRGGVKSITFRLRAQLSRSQKLWARIASGLRTVRLTTPTQGMLTYSMGSSKS